jgi:hypothetical protein
MDEGRLSQNKCIYLANLRAPLSTISSGASSLHVALQPFNLVTEATASLALPQALNATTPSILASSQ